MPPPIAPPERPCCIVIPQYHETEETPESHLYLWVHEGGPILQAIQEVMRDEDDDTLGNPAHLTTILICSLAEYVHGVTVGRPRWQPEEPSAYPDIIIDPIYESVSIGPPEDDALVLCEKTMIWPYERFLAAEIVGWTVDGAPLSTDLLYPPEGFSKKLRHCRRHPGCQPTWTRDGCIVGIRECSCWCDVCKRRRPARSKKH